MSISSPSIQPAQPADLETIFAIMNRANQYSLEKAGEYQWIAIDHARDEIRSHLAKGNCYAMRHEGVVVALLVLAETDDYLWGDEGKDGTALYFCKLMKDPETAPPHSGIALISFAAHEALRRHKKFLRCDAKPITKHLIKHYEKLGLRTKRHTRYAISGKKTALLEADPQEVLERIAVLQT